MTIFINARFLSQPLSGVQRFASEILDALDHELECDPKLRKQFGPIVALRPPDTLRQPRWRNIALREIGGGRGHVWEQGALYRASKNGILVSLGNTGPLRHPAQMLTLHDANIWDIPNAFSTRYRILHKAIRPILANRVRSLLSVSTFSAQALSNHLGLSQQRFSIVPNGADHITRTPADPSVLQRHTLRKRGYFLSVGNQSPNKNIARLVHAHRLAGPTVDPLVIVGEASAALETLHLSQSKRVILLGRVDDAALRSLYENATGFVFPSLYEGFGIPPLEAMQLGTPVLAANRTALPEILQDGPIWFDPFDVKSMAQALQQLSDMGETERSDVIERGKEIAAEFTWDKSARLLAQQILTLQATTTSAARGVHSRDARLARKVS